MYMDMLREAVSEEEFEDIKSLLKDYLLKLMRELSEDWTACGWYINLEYYLWMTVTESPLLDNEYEADFFSCIDESVRKKLKLTASLCNGWWVYDSSNRFVEMSEWEDMYNKWKSK